MIIILVFTGLVLLDWKRMERKQW